MTIVRGEEFPPGTPQPVLQYVIALRIPEDSLRGDDSIERVCGLINGYLNDLDAFVQPLSEVIAC